MNPPVLLAQLLRCYGIFMNIPTPQKLQTFSTQGLCYVLLVRSGTAEIGCHHGILDSLSECGIPSLRAVGVELRVCGCDRGKRHKMQRKHHAYAKRRTQVSTYASNQRAKRNAVAVIIGNPRGSGYQMIFRSIKMGRPLCQR